LVSVVASSPYAEPASGTGLNVIKAMTRLWRDARRSLWRTIVAYWDAILVINLCLVVPSLTSELSTPTRVAVYLGLVGTAAFVFFRRLSPIVRDNAHYFRALLGMRPERADTRYVRALFDEYAGRFEDHLMIGLHYTAPNLVFDIASDYLGDEPLHVVDLGCGTGLCGPLFAPFARDLIGVDLSSEMLKHADQKQCYDMLVESDILDFLAAQDGIIDLCLAADVFVYFGDLDAPLGAISRALRPGGSLAFTVETTAKPGWILRRSGRYAHSDRHVEARARTAGLQVMEHRTSVLRMQSDQPVNGMVWLLRKPY